MFTFATSFWVALEKRKHSNVYVPRHLGKVAFGPCLLVMLVSLFLWKVPTAQGHTNATPTYGHFTGLHTSARHASGNMYRAPLNHAKSNGPFVVSLSESETESEDDIQDAGFSFFTQAGYLVSALRSLQTELTLSALPPPFLQNRPTVPLFVLFHSWKNFIR